jgi:hypothetical protein
MTKKNLRKIPQHVWNRITHLAVDDIVVACVKRIDRAEISEYQHHDLHLTGDSLSVPPPTIPSEDIGKYCAINIYGKEVVRRDLPMTSKTYTVEVPNCGDWSNGSHDMSWSRDVYQRDLIPPKELTLSIELLKQDLSTFTVKFSVDQVLRRTQPDFQDELLYNLNILQEAVGSVDVFGSQATLGEYLSAVRVDWEILPPGKIDGVLGRMLQGKRPVSEETRHSMRERLGVMARLSPRQYIAGTSEFLRYFGAQFEDDFVAFENLHYGNALYVMYERWEQLSKRSRVDLLKGPRDGFERILHNDNWASRLEQLLQRHPARMRSGVGGS